MPPIIRPSTHPLVLAKLSQLRATGTPPAEFRALVRGLASLLAVEATTGLPTRPIEVETPMGLAAGVELADSVGIVPILRAGLGMADGVLDLIPKAAVWHLGFYRDEQTLRPMEYYNKLPRRCGVTLALIVDPMLATGGSAARACEVVKAWGVPKIMVLALIAAPEGIERLGLAHPDIPIHVGAIDERLNEVGFIVPGLGDAGDRQFGTAGD